MSAIHDARPARPARPGRRPGSPATGHPRRGHAEPRRVRRALRRRVRGLAVDRRGGVDARPVRDRRRAARRDGRRRRAAPTPRRGSRSSAPIRSWPGRPRSPATLTPESTREQAAAGLDRLTPRQHADVLALTAAYRERFSFPFVVCAREHTADSIIAAARARLDHDTDVEEAHRARRDREDRGAAAGRPRRRRRKDIRLTGARISYGKLSVPVHLVRGDRLLAADVSMEVLGQGFLPAYTEGDNSAVVATDTMKNVILRRAHEYAGETLEGLLYDLGRGFLSTYPEMEGLRLWAQAQPWVAESGKLFRRVDGDHAVATLELAPGGAVVAHEAGHVGLRLLKTTGSAFTKFARDDGHDAARAQRPAAVHPPRRALALRRPGRRGRRRARAVRRRPGDRARDLRRVRVGVDPAPGLRDGPAGAGARSRRWRRSRSTARTTPTTRCRAPRTPSR